MGGGSFHQTQEKVLPVWKVLHSKLTPIITDFSWLMYWHILEIFVFVKIKFFQNEAFVDLGMKVRDGDKVWPNIMFNRVKSIIISSLFPSYIYPKFNLIIKYTFSFLDFFIHFLAFLIFPIFFYWFSPDYPVCFTIFSCFPSFF